MKRIMVILCCLHCIAQNSSRALAQTVPAPTVAGIVQQIQGSPAGADFQPLFDAGIKLLQQKNTATLQDDLKLWSAIATQGQKSHDTKSADIVRGLLIQKYKDEPDALFLISSLQYSFYNTATDPQKARQVLKEGEESLKAASIRVTLARLQIWMLSGDGYLTSARNDENSRQHALMYYRQVLNYIVDEEDSNLEPFKPIYLQAAIRLVGLSNTEELHATSLFPFAVQEISKLNPGKAALLDPTFPVIARNKARLMEWLQFAIEGETNDSPMRPQLQAVLDYLKQQH